jgi:hypothetical protein
MKTAKIIKPLRLVALLFLAATMLGCPPQRTDEPVTLSPSQASWSQIAAAHNQRVAMVPRMWSRAIVELRWADEDGDLHYEQGDGPLILRRPSDTALAIGKLGKTRLWLGSNEHRYWLFHLGDERVAYVGRTALADQALDRKDYPLPVRPDRLVDLLGLTPLPTDLPTQPQVFQRSDGLRQVTLAAGNATGLAAGWSKQMRFDTQHRLVWLEWRRPDGSLALSAKLDRYQRMAIDGRPPGAWPYVPGYLDIRLPARQARVTLTIADAQSGEGKIKDTQFDFAQLIEALNIEAIGDLDAPPN